MARLVTLAALSLGLLLTTACPAGACSCAPMGDEEAADRAHVVFVGVVTEHHDPAEGANERSSMDPISWTFDVESVEKGEVGQTATVVSAMSDASCGYPFRLGARYRVFAMQDSDGLRTGLCDGTEELAMETPPEEEAGEEPAPEPPPAEEAPDDSRAVGDGLAVAAFGLLGATGYAVARASSSRRRMITRRASTSSAPSKMDSTRASTK